MRAYSYVVPTFWTRGSGKRLRGNPAAQALALYVMTAPSSNMIGLYYVPLTTIAAETGLPAGELPELFKAISEIAKYDQDNEIVWIPEAAAHQIGEELKPLDKRRAQVLRDLESMGGHPFAVEFFDKYELPYRLEATKAITEAKALTTKQDAPSEGLPVAGMPRSPVLSCPASSPPLRQEPEPTPQKEITIPDPDLLPASPKDLTGSARGVEPPSGVALKARVSPFMRSVTPADSDELWIFERWRETFEKPDALFDPGRSACLAARLISGMTRQDALDALQGATFDDFVMGRKDGKRHDRLSFIFESQERYEEFRDRGRAKREGRDPDAPRVDPKAAELAKRRTEAIAAREARELAEHTERARESLRKRGIDPDGPLTFDPASVAKLVNG